MADFMSKGKSKGTCIAIELIHVYITIYNNPR